MKTINATERELAQIKEDGIMGKYLASGQKVWVSRELEEGGFLVENIYEDYNRDPENYRPDYQQIYFVENVFDKAPTKVFDERIAILEKKIKVLREEERELSKTIREVSERHKASMDKFKKHEKLSLLENFIDGKITHYVDFGYDARIIDFNDAKCEYDKEDLKLLTLFGNSKGDLTWRLSSYSDGSSGRREVIPCCSYEEAQKALQLWMDEEIKETISEKYVDLAKKYNLKIEPDYIKKVRDDQIAQNNKQIKGHLEEIEKYKSKNKAIGG